MINDIERESDLRMKKSIELLHQTLAKIRTGRAHSSLLENIKVDYYGSETPLSQVANITTEDARTLAVRVWEKSMIQEVEKAILKSDLGLNPASAGEVIRVPLPPLTEETRKNYTRQARQEAEQTRITIRNIRRTAVAEFKNLEKEKQISEDENRKSQEDIQKLTDKYIKLTDQILATKEQDLMII